MDRNRLYGCDKTCTVTNTEALLASYLQLSFIEFPCRIKLFTKWSGVCVK